MFCFNAQNINKTEELFFGEEVKNLIGESLESIALLVWRMVCDMNKNRV